MPDRRLKLTKVKAKSGLATFHKTFDAIWQAIPSRLKAALTSDDLVALVGAMKAQHQHGGVHRQEEILQTGRLYVKGGYRDIGPLIAWPPEDHVDC